MVAFAIAPCAQAFNEEDSEALLQEWHKAENLQPVPPPTPNGYLKVRLRAETPLSARGCTRAFPSCCAPHSLPRTLSRLPSERFPSRRFVRSG